MNIWPFKCSTLVLVNVLICFTNTYCAQVTNAQLSSVDIEHYSLEIKVNDSTDVIEVVEWVTLKWLDTLNTVKLNLVDLNKEGKGMHVKSISDGNTQLSFSHKDAQLNLIGLKSFGRKDIELQIVFSGIPIDGLVIGENKYGNRTFFGDNWPNRAQNWFACIDHPSDKATINYRVQVPDHYEVIANGIFVGKQKMNNSESLYEYSSNIPLPTKVMVIGIADFEVKALGVTKGVPVSSWVYPENKENGFYDLDLAPQILTFFIDYIGPYEYEKLANVQSTTRYGGMENAGCIFYDENALNGKRTSEDLIAHEIAHQWFGNSASEKEWEHIWLSEGFATYFTNLYIEKSHGIKAMQEQMIKDRTKVIRFYQNYPHPLVDSNFTSLLDLLNPNSYQKGAWVLHMLRLKMGDEQFQKGIVAYYQKYRLSNATTTDLKMVFEETSGIELTQFFNEWVYSAGHPQLKINVKSKKKDFSLSIEQKQASNYSSIPLTLQIVLKNGERIQKEFQLTDRSFVFTETFKKKIKSWSIDPNVDLLFETVN